MLLFGDTARRIKPYKSLESSDLWFSMWGNFFKLTFLFMISPIILYAIVISLLGSLVDFIDPNADYFATILLIIIYLTGVHMTYKHVIWREKNIPHLLNTSIKIQNKANDERLRNNLMNSDNEELKK